MTPTPSLSGVMDSRGKSYYRLASVLPYDGFRCFRLSWSDGTENLACTSYRLLLEHCTPVEARSYPQVVVQGGRLQIIPPNANMEVTDPTPSPQQAAARAQSPAFLPGADGAASARAPPARKQNAAPGLPEAL